MKDNYLFSNDYVTFLNVLLVVKTKQAQYNHFKIEIVFLKAWAWCMLEKGKV